MDKYDGFIRPIRLDFDDENPDFSPEELQQIDISGLEYANEYKEAIIWSFDTSLALFIDQGLTGIMGFPYTYPLDGIKEARDVFRAYHQCEDIIETTEDDMLALEWAFDWLKDNFLALWT
ncbi:MAG: hypothetical protein KDA17_01400 [Candidatus Saccharibacteria bacterium]|nr:hypothetical protein [Candidatus Saccharibacteria bacterium]